MERFSLTFFFTLRSTGETRAVDVDVSAKGLFPSEIVLCQWDILMRWINFIVLRVNIYNLNLESSRVFDYCQKLKNQGNKGFKFLNGKPKTNAKHSPST